MKISLYGRKPFPGQVSLEAQFEHIRAALPAEFQTRTCTSRFVSKGLWRRVVNLFDAALNQSDINHITGDVHYLGLMLDPRKTILTVHDCSTMYGRPWPARMILRWFWYVLPARRAAAVTTISEKSRRELAGILRVDARSIRVIPDCVGGEFTWSPKEFRSECPEILQIGTRPNKNLIRLAEALRGIPCRLRIVGQLDAAAERALRENRIEHVNEFGLTAAQIVERYRACDIVTFVSTYEGFGVPVLEGQATGRPVVTSNIAPMRDIAGEGACLADPLDPASIRQCVLRLMNDAVYRESVVRRGLENASRYRPAAIAAQYAALYAEIYRGPLNSRADSADIPHRARA